MLSEIQPNVKAFTAELQKKIKQEVGNKSELVLKATKALFFDIAKDNPVLSGQSACNWRMEINKPSGEFTKISKHARMSEGEILSVNIKNSDIKFDIMKDDSIWIDNNTPYIETLEDGYSTKKPTGWVAANLSKHVKKLQNL